MNFRGRARSRPARGKSPKTQETSTNCRIQTISGKKEAECKGKRAQTRERANQGGWRSSTLDRQNDQETHKEWGRPTSQSASKACSSSIIDRWLGPCCSVRTAAQRLRSFLGRRRRPAAAAAAVQIRRMALPLIHHVHTKHRPLKVDKRYLPAIGLSVVSLVVSRKTTEDFT